MDKTFSIMKRKKESRNEHVFQIQHAISNLEYAASTRIFEFQILFEAAVFYDMLITPKNSLCTFGGKHSCKQCFQLYSISKGMTLMQYRILESISKHVNI